MISEPIIDLDVEVCSVLSHKGVFARLVMSRGGKIGPTRWANPIRLELGSGRAIKFLT